MRHTNVVSVRALDNAAIGACVGTSQENNRGHYIKPAE
jgi:hypothetical protein